MPYAVSPGGLLVHARGDWPCAVCRPDGTAERRGLLLCTRCAQGMILAVEAGVEGPRALLDELTDALSMFQSAEEEAQASFN